VGEHAIACPEPQASVSSQSTVPGLNPTAAFAVSFWYSLTAAAAMSSGFAFLYRNSQNEYYLAQSLMWSVGIGIGIAIGVYLARNSRFAVGIISSFFMSGLLLSLLRLGGNGGDSDVSMFGFRPSTTQFLLGMAALTLFFGMLGAIGGSALRSHESVADLSLGIRSRHWFWLWLAVYAWVAILPTGIYYLWLEIISTGYVLIHPSLWFSEAWTEGWTLTFGMFGFVATVEGIKLSMRMVSTTNSSHLRTRKRVLHFLLGTLILAGPVANILFRIAIYSLQRLPDGITTNPWWILR
jgi:hypothetical protein